MQVTYRTLSYDDYFGIRASSRKGGSVWNPVTHIKFITAGQKIFYEHFEVFNDYHIWDLKTYVIMYKPHCSKMFPL